MGSVILVTVIFCTDGTAYRCGTHLMNDLLLEVDRVPMVAIVAVLGPPYVVSCRGARSVDSGEQDRSAYAHHLSDLLRARSMVGFQCDLEQLCSWSCDDPLSVARVEDPTTQT